MVQVTEIFPHGRQEPAQGVWKSSAPGAARWSRKFEMNEWMKKTFWASYFALKPKIFSDALLPAIKPLI